MDAVAIARAITERILRVTDVVYKDNLEKKTEEAIQRQLRNHGLGTTTEERTKTIASFEFTRTVALLYHVCIHPAMFDIPAAYFLCTRAVNTLVCVLGELETKSTAANTSGVLIRQVAPILRDTWDISVLLLGATRTRAQLIGENSLQLEDNNFFHAKHHRARVDDVLNKLLNHGSVCPRALAHFTREDPPLFVRTNCWPTSPDQTRRTIISMPSARKTTACRTGTASKLKTTTPLIALITVLGRWSLHPSPPSPFSTPSS
ncbi:hypothetical protein B0T16DRAFT_194540 [Cercophora newfieldiana]|uniref:Uncharacterized protein n=1 Tax=Cercophora newfieldiana TaxID=92897 RepID=A0AA40CMU2_9PEZI|nr:hypothetical protein B0T16DRAFT_194540 [Cercophora newfieldiana]